MLFRSIDSALRRSWIRKKKVKVVLSGDSSGSVNNPGLSLARRSKVSCVETLFLLHIIALSFLSNPNLDRTLISSMA